MARPARLQKPPIQEALVDFVFVGGTTGIEALQGLASSFEADGWSKKQILEATVEATIALEEGKQGEIRQKSAHVGYALSEPSGQKIVQVREDRLTISHLGNYSSWEDLEGDAISAFEKFCSAIHPVAVSRVAARFINRIPLPNDFAGFDAFLTNPPRLVGDLGEGALVTDFVRRQAIRGLDSDCAAVLNVATAAPNPGETSPSLVLDIDVFKQQASFEPSAAEVRPLLHAIRTIKNAIFFGSLTESALDPFR